MPNPTRWIILTLAVASAVCAQTSLPPAVPALNGGVRAHWLLVENLDGGSVADDIVVGAADTFLKTPKEYGTHWSGFGKRTGLIAANYGVRSTMEAGLGAIWGEDPRYFRTEGLPLRSRLAYVVKATFLARNRQGQTMPAWSRLIATPGGNFLANTWQPDSQAKVSDAVIRTGLNFLSRMGENAWKEFIVRH